MAEALATAPVLILIRKKTFSMARSRKALTAGAVGVAALALIAASSSVTGAYFTDSHNGAVNASTGVVAVSTSDLSLNFDKSLPGEFTTRNVSYTAKGSGAVDIWLVLPAGTAPMLNGIPKLVPEPAPPRRFGHFAVTAPTGSFTSFNLSSAPASEPKSSCWVDATTGHGGSATQAATADDKTVPYCGVPSAILLSSNLVNGQSEAAEITFGFTKIMTGNQGSAYGPLAPFKIVATQHGILPSDPNNVIK